MAIFPLWYNRKRRTKRRYRLEKEQQAMSSMPMVKALILVQSVFSLHNFLQSSIPHNSGVPWKVTTLTMDSMFFFAESLYWWTPQKGSPTEKLQLFLASLLMMKGLWDVFYTHVFLVLLFVIFIFNIEEEDSRQKSDTSILPSNEETKTSATRPGLPRPLLSTDSKRNPNETCP